MNLFSTKVKLCYIIKKFNVPELESIDNIEVDILSNDKGSDISPFPKYHIKYFYLFEEYSTPVSKKCNQTP